MIKVYGIRPAHSGFGNYQLDVEGVEYPELNSVGEYIAHALAEAIGLYPVVDEEDEGYDEVAAADGATYDQGNGTIIGWRDRDGNVQLECVYA